MNEYSFTLLILILMMVFVLILVWSGVDLRDMSACKGETLTDYSEFLPFYYFALSSVLGLWLAAHSIGVILRLARFG
ncbi:hypothetical protein ACRS45_09390 [Klebsiella pneumoniae]